jgi:hypothetical protein
MLSPRFELGISEIQIRHKMAVPTCLIFMTAPLICFWKRHNSVISVTDETNLPNFKNFNEPADRHTLNYCAEQISDLMGY